MEYLLIFSLGASIASFLGVVIERFPQQSIVTPASHCDRCRHKLAWYDLIPIFSQLLSGFRCRYCQIKIPPWYALFEAIIGCLALLTYLNYLDFWLAYCLVFSLTLTIYDLKTRSFPLIIWLAFSLPILFYFGFNSRAVTLLSLALLAEFKDIKIGSGDLFYLASLSLTLGLTDLLWTIQIGSLTALFVALYQLKKGPQSPIPFVPFLLIGYMCVSFL
ncbi:prepilin peptidase [Streptococcus caprae]|uniref:Prepilin peptidase n=1 Tax=Streptococcus caprae TaxID=1640501 RepID=A0ABV8CXA4_9STRE